jgi:hypothetical protein
MNRNKRSIALNLKTEDAGQVFYKLAETADAVVEEFRLGVTKRLGVDSVVLFLPVIEEARGDIMTSTDLGRSGGLAYKLFDDGMFQFRRKARCFPMTRSFLHLGGPRSCHHSNIFCPAFRVHSTI